MKNKLSLKFEDIAVLTTSETAMVGGGFPGRAGVPGGTMGCSEPCQTTVDSSNCKTTTGGNDNGCKPTSKGCF